MRTLTIAAIIFMSPLYLLGYNKESSPKKWISPKNNKGFLENKGQMADAAGNTLPHVLFKTESQNLNFWITEDGITVQTFNLVKTPLQGEELRVWEEMGGELTGIKNTKKSVEWERVDIELKGATINKDNIVRENPVQGQFNYFLPQCPDGIYGVKEYEKVIIKEVYPGIDWIFYRKKDGTLKYDFVVNPGADYNQIELLYKSKTPISINEQGQIELYTDYGNIRENSPVSYYENREVTTYFRENYQKNITIHGDLGYETSVSFQLDLKTKHTNTSLIIDPELVWSTFFGGNSNDGPMSIDTDAAGNVFISGYVSSSTFPLLDPGSGAYFQGTIAPAVTHAFVSKFNNDGVMLWSTYYGGSGNQNRANSIACDLSGNIFVVGETNSTDLPLLNPGGGAYYRSDNESSTDAFVLKFDNDGIRVWATYYGGNDLDQGKMIACDGDGNVYFTGRTSSNNFPVLDPGGGAYYDGTYGGGFGDVFIAKFNNSGVQLWSTYYGVGSMEWANAITCDNDGNVFVTGFTSSGGFPTLDAGGGAYYQGAKAASSDAFILKFNSSGSRIWATFYGGNGSDRGYSIAADNDGNIFLLGYTESTNLPRLNPGGTTYYQNTNAGGWDAFILKFDNDGVREWATYFGGTGDDFFEIYTTTDNIAIDSCNNVFMAIETGSTGLPTQVACSGGYFDDSYNGNTSDIYLVKFQNDGTIDYATYIGGDGRDVHEPLAVDRIGNLFMTGEWINNPNPATYPLNDPGGGAYYDNTYNGNDDGFMFKLAVLPDYTQTQVEASCVCDGEAYIRIDNACPPYTFNWSNGEQLVETTDNEHTVTGLCPGDYWVEVVSGCTRRDTLHYTITSDDLPDADAGDDKVLTCTATTVILDGSSITPGATASWTGPGIVSGGSTFTPTVNQSGEYIITVTDPVTMCEYKDTMEVTFNTTPPDADAGSDKVLTCNDTSVDLEGSSTTPSATASWTGPGIVSGGTTFTPTVDQPGTYEITVTDPSNGCTNTSSVEVTEDLSPPDATIDGSTLVCINDPSVTYTGGSPGGTWSASCVGCIDLVTGEFDPTTAGTGSHTITYEFTGGCPAIDNLVIEVVDEIDITLTPLGSFCLNDETILLSASPDGGIWSGTGLVDPANNTFTPILAGIGEHYLYYYVPGNCGGTDSILVTVHPVPTAEIQGGDVTIEEGESVTLSTITDDHILWSSQGSVPCSDCNSIIVSPSQDTEYTLTLTNDYGCSVSTSTFVFVQVLCGDVFVPDIFSPNADGINDELCVYNNCIQTMEFFIFNRWGERVFETTSINDCWDGTHRGEPVNTDVFVYKLVVTLTTGEEVVKKGNISVVR